MSSILSYLGLYRDVPTSNWKNFNERFRSNEQAKAIYQEYFSSYANGYLPLNRGVLDQVGALADRREIGQKIGEEWNKVLQSDLGGVHRQLPSQKSLESALHAQFCLEEEQLQLKEVDQILGLRHGRLGREINILERAQGFRYYLLSKKEYEYVAEIEKRAKAKGVKFTHEARECVQKKKDLQTKLDRRVDALRARVLVKPDLRPVLQGALLAPYQDSIAERDDLHSSLRDHSVFVHGDPILDGKAIFFIVKRPADMPEKEWRQFLNSEQATTRLSTVKLDKVPPNHEFFPFVDPKYRKIAVCYEPVGETMRLHENRGLLVKTRRRVVGQGQYERTNRPDESRFFQGLWRDMWQKGWSDNRKATAGPDCYEAIALQRCLMQTLLGGKMALLKDTTVQDLGEYFGAMANSDVAKLPGSYMGNENFAQAHGLHQFSQDQLRRLCEKREALAGMKVAIDTEYHFADEEGRLSLLSQDLFESYETWRGNLDRFLTALDDDQNKKVRDLLGPHLIANLRVFKQLLTEFLADAPHPDIRPVLQQRRAILTNNPLPTAQRQQQLDAVWMNWKQGKTKAEIEVILRASIEQIKRCLNTFTQGQVVIGALLSNPSFQEMLTKAMKPELFPVFNGAIPPFWQNKAKVSIFVKELLKGSDTEETWLDAADAMAMTRSQVIKNELLRSRQVKLDLAARAPF